MNKFKILFLIAACFLQCEGREPFKPHPGSVPFVVYFASRYRGICVGVMVSRVAVLTAAVCVTNPMYENMDTRPINVVLGAEYRHPRRGIRVQVTKVLIPNLRKMASDNLGFLMSKTPAVLLLKRKIPDILTEIPVRPIAVDWKGEDELNLQEECFMAGWHFFYKGDKVYGDGRFLLQRNIRVQFVNIVKKNLWCEALSIKFTKALTNLGFHGMIEKSSKICVRDPDRTAQACHGMYGSPLVCRGKAVGMLLAPDAQWTNCTGLSNLVHIFASEYLSPFMKCVSSLFEVEETRTWTVMKKSLYEDITAESYDYVPEFYDKFTSKSEEEEHVKEE